jgi:hypothetical protein
MPGDPPVAAGDEWQPIVQEELKKYTRTFEVKELSVPLNKVEELKKLYRIIAGDERNTAVLKPAGH